MPLTVATGSSLWPTPRVALASYYIESLDTALARGRSWRETLPTAVAKSLKMWPTPTEHGNYNRKGASEKSGDGLATAVMGLTSDGKLLL